MFFKIAVNNVRRSLKDYAIYFLTLTFGVCLFYVFNSMDSQSAMTSLNTSQVEIIQLLTKTIGYVSIFISFILGFLIIYSNRFLMKRRKKELGIYMLLGMDKGKISRILIVETLLIGLFSLGIGLTLGIFASQGLSAITAGIFEMDLSSFQFTFSVSAFLKTLLYFGIIFVVVMVFNTISITKYKLITLLQANRKNESFKVRNLWISVVAFLVSIACIGIAYYLVLTRGWESFGMLLTCLILGTVGTLLFFFSLSGFLLRVIQSNKRLYYKGLNMFILRQFNSKINTTFISVGLICLMLFVTLVTFSTGMSVATASSQAVKGIAPYNYSVTQHNGSSSSDDRAPFEYDSIVNEYKLQDTLNKYASDYFEFSTYYGQIGMSEIPNILPERNEQIGKTYLQMIKLSDYNRIAQSQGKEPITLKDNEFAVNCNTQQGSLYKMENDQTIKLGDKTYSLGIHQLLDITMYNTYSYMDNGTLILPDAAFEGLVPDTRYLNVKYNQDGDDYAKEATEAFGSTLNYQLYSVDRESAYQSNVGTSVIVSYLSIYIGLIFLITCVAILALQQLSEASDNTMRYNLLRKLGADRKMINRALFAQIAIYFAMPLVLAIGHAIVGIKFASFLVEAMSGGANVLPITLITAGIMLVVYGGYFLATYIGCKSMIRPKKN